MFLVTCSEDAPPELRELLDQWMIGEARARAYEGWRHTIFALFQREYPLQSHPLYKWTYIAPERVDECDTADDAQELCDELLEQLLELRLAT